MIDFRSAVADKLVDIENIARNFGLHQLTRITLIARNPDNERMSVVVSNEGNEENLRAACAVATKLRADDKIVNGDGTLASKEE